MKVICKTEEIREASNLVTKITGKNLSLPVLQYVLFLVSGNSIKLRATNLQIGIEKEVKAKVSKEWVVAVDGNILSGVLEGMNDEFVELNLDGSTLQITSGKSSVELNTFPYEDFPTLPVVAPENTFMVDSEAFSGAIKSVYYASATSDIKPEIASVFMYVENSDLVFVGTDAFRLGEKKISVKKADDMSGILIPIKNTHEILRILGSTKGDITVSFGGNQLAISSDSLFIVSRLIDGVFPDYRQIVPKEETTTVTILREELVSTLKISNIFSDRFNELDMLVDPQKKQTHISSKNSDVGTSDTEIDAAMQGEKINIRINQKYLWDCLQSMSADSVTLSFNGENKPVLVRGVGDKSFLYLIMPVHR